MKEKDYPVLSGKLLKIMSEFEKTEQARSVAQAVSIFGSARFSKENQYYQIAQDIAAKLAKCGFSIISGGGPGVMEAANKGALVNENVASMGVNISLPHEQIPNQFQNFSLFFEHFPPRKFVFVENSSAFVVMPGGFGTLDELFEVLTLIQTTKIEAVPIVLVGVKFWEGLIDWLKNSLITEQTIKSEDLDLFKVVDSADEAVNYLSACLKH